MRRFRNQSNEHTFSKAKDILEVIKYVVEILAIAIAGVWAYSKYVKIEKPLEIRSASTGYLNWTQLPTKNICLANLGVTIKNIGTSPFEIKKVVVESWLIDDAILKRVDKHFLPFNDPKKKLLVRKEFLNLGSTSLIGTYGVDEENSTDFSFTVKNKPNAVVYILASVAGPYVNIKEGRWGFVCDARRN